MNDPDRELARQLISERTLPLVAHGVLFAALVLLMWDTVPRALLAGWGAVIAAVWLARVIGWEQARRRALPPPTVLATARATLLALGLAWGMGAAVVSRYLPAGDAILVVLGLTGLLAGALATLVADRWSFPVYAVAMFGPPLAALVIIEREGGGAGVRGMAPALMLAFLLFTIRLHRRSHDALREGLRVEAALRDNQRQLAEAQQVAHVGSWELDLTTSHATWSDEAYRLWGVPLGSPVNYNVFATGLHPEDRARVEQLVGEALAQGRPIEFECRIVRPGGQVRHLLNRNVVVRDQDGRPMRLMGTCLDVTDLKLAEERVKVLQGILPICASCKRIRSDDGKWEPVESYVRDHSEAEFSHGLCPECARRDWGVVEPGAGP